MALDAQTGTNFSALLTAHSDRLVDRWTERAARTLRGRLTESELRQQITELYSALCAAASGNAFDLNSEDAAELRALLGDLSRERARRGFSPRETAVSVLALKDALIEVFDVGGGDAATLRDLIAVTQMIDQLGL